MAIIDIRERPERSLRQGQGLEREMPRRFYVKTDDPATDQVDIETSGLLPAYGDPHPLDAGLLVLDYEIRQAGRGNYLWTADYTYSRAPIVVVEAERRTIPNPLDRSPHIEIEFAPAPRVIFRDQDGEAILNSAGQPYGDPLVEEDERVRIVITRNLTTWPTFLFTFRRSVNSDTVSLRGQTFGPRTLRFAPGRVGDFAIENGVTYLPVTYYLEHREETWDASVADNGWMRKTDAGALVPIEIGGERTATPMFLDGNGKLLSPVTPSSVVYRTHRLRKELPYASLVS